MTITIIEPVMGTAVPIIAGVAVPSGIKRKFTHCTAYNTAVAVIQIKIYLVPADQTVGVTNCYVDYDLQPRETYTCPEVVGAALGTGGTLQVLGAGVAFSAVSSDTAS